MISTSVKSIRGRLQRLQNLLVAAVLAAVMLPTWPVTAGDVYFDTVHRGAAVSFGAWAPTARVDVITVTNGGAWAAGATGTWYYALQPQSARGWGALGPETNAVVTATGQLVRFSWGRVGGATNVVVWRGAASGALTNFAAAGVATNFLDLGTNTWSTGTVAAATDTNVPTITLGRAATSPLEPVTLAQAEALIGQTNVLTGTNQFAGDVSGLWSNLQIGAGAVGTNEIDPAIMAQIGTLSGTLDTDLVIGVSPFWSGDNRISYQLKFVTDNTGSMFRIGNDFYLWPGSGTLSDYKLITRANDGEGSGLDADTWRGQTPSAFSRLNSIVHYETWTFTSGWGVVSNGWTNGVTFTSGSISNGLLYVNGTNLLFDGGTAAGPGVSLVEIDFAQASFGAVLQFLVGTNVLLEANGYTGTNVFQPFQTDVISGLKIRFNGPLLPGLTGSDDSIAIRSIKRYGWSVSTHVGSTNDQVGLRVLVDDPVSARGAVNKQTLDAARADLESQIDQITPSLSGSSYDGKPLNLSPNWRAQVTNETLRFSYAGQPAFDLVGGGTVTPQIVSMGVQNGTSTVVLVSSPAWRPMLEYSSNLVTWLSLSTNSYSSTWPAISNSTYTLKWVATNDWFYRVLATTTNSAGVTNGRAVFHLPVDVPSGSLEELHAFTTSVLWQIYAAVSNTVEGRGWSAIAPTQTVNFGTFRATNVGAVGFAEAVEPYAIGSIGTLGGFLRRFTSTNGYATLLDTANASSLGIQSTAGFNSAITNYYRDNSAAGVVTSQNAAATYARELRWVGTNGYFYTGARWILVPGVSNWSHSP